jgi:hypothetical protein
MLRNVLGVVAALALPSMLVGQAPTPPNPAAGLTRPHGIAMQIQGEVVGAPSGIDVANNQKGPNEAVNNGEPDGLNDDVEVGDQVDQGGEHDQHDDTPAPPPGSAHVRMIGRHKP